MNTVQIKIVEEGFKHPVDALLGYVSAKLFDDDILVRDDADWSLKIKFLHDNDQELVLLQLRDSHNKTKLNEKVIHYLEDSWMEDISAEAHALIASAPVPH
jgi:hypothetical protein